jgi:uncharacterized protein (TIGR00255 family)
MLRSMTGFGRGTGRAGATEATVEVRSVNGRFCEVAVRGPRVLNAFDPAVQALCREQLERGSISVSVALQRRTAEAALAVDRDAARAYGRLLLQLQAAAGLDPHTAPVTLDHLLRYDVLTSAEPDVEAEQAEAWAAVEPALQEALGRLDAMRVQEGRALREDLAVRLDALGAHLDAVAARAPERVREAQARLRERLAELAGDDRLNPDRLETEIALLADRLDVTEEVVRLRSHLAQFREALDGEGAVGRRLNFLAQELNREVNTIASKANDAELAARAVRMKEELEKVREQVQNVV